MMINNDVKLVWHGQIITDNVIVLLWLDMAMLWIVMVDF